MKYLITPANVGDLEGIESLLPRLADFDVPAHRNPDHLWQGDREIIRQWASGTRSDMDIIVALTTEARTILGVAVITTRNELLSGEPSAHLEVLALAKSAEGFGIGSALMQESETVAASRGARSLSLHVFANNTKARALYERQGFDGELMRYYKPLDSK